MFDVFDTVVTRATVRPEADWSLVPSRLDGNLDLDVSVERYVTARRKAESRASQAHDGCATLEEIHQQLTRILGWPDSTWELTARAEIEVELELSRPVDRGRELLGSARALGIRIIFVSDMHLPSRAIRTLLEKHGCWAQGDELWVSSEARARKKTGEIFLQIAAVSDVDLSTAVHIGDQPLADRIAPRWVGILPIASNIAQINRYERSLLLSELPNDLGHRLAGAARAARVADSGTTQDVHSVATDVVGPTLVAFALWILDQSQRRDLERLYFLSRDGEILLHVTARLARALNVEVDLRYLYGGRLAWRFPSLAAASDEHWSGFLDEVVFRYTVVSLGGIARRLGLDSTDLSSAMDVGPDEALDGRQRAEVRAQLDLPDVREVFVAAAARQGHLAAGYFEQEGLTTSGRFAVVDVGWMGETMRALAALLSPADAPLSLFFGWSGANDLPGGSDAYLWGGQRLDRWRRMPPIAAHLEMFCAGTHGVVAGYEERHGRYEPVLLSHDSAAARSWPLHAMQTSVLRYVDTVAPDLRAEDLACDTRLAIEALLRDFREDPGRSVARTWGDFPREEDPQGQSVFPIARPFRLADIPALGRPGPFAGRNLAWPEAAKSRTSRGIRPLIAAILAMRALARRSTG